MRSDSSRFQLLLLSADLLLVIGLLLTAVGWNFGRPGPDAALSSALLLSPAAILCFHWAGAYALPPTARLFDSCRAALNGLLLTVLVLVAAIYVFRLDNQFPRLAVLVWFIASAIGVVGVRAVLLRLLRWRERGRSPARPVVLAGNFAQCVAFHQHLRDQPQTGMVCVAIASDDSGLIGDGLVLGRLLDVARLAQEVGASRVVVCSRPDDADLLDRLMALLMPYPFEVYFAPDLSRIPLFCLGIEDWGGYPLISLTGSPLSHRDLLTKRLEDVVLSLVILLLISWLLVLIAIAVKLTSRGPVLFIQNRHGLMGQTIRVWKFRTMTWLGPDPAQEDSRAGRGTKPAFDPIMNPDTGLFRQTIPGDIRVTPVGALLRRTSLDELPQFFNVLGGSMSIVGPRPHARLHNLQFLPDVPWLMRRHYVKPGITGLAQISGSRGETRTSQDMQRRVAFDLEYIRSWSLWLDIRIIARTLLTGFWTRQP